nr:ISWI chromatin-remodeling complex ATPase CHR11 [Ipomoea batatas]
MAKRSRSKSSSPEPLSDIPEEERVNDQVNDELDGEEPEAVGRAGEDSETEDQAGEEDNDEAATDEEEENEEEDDDGANETAKPEKATLKEMQRLKKGKTQEVLEAQNAAIDADDMVESIGSSSFSGDLNDNFESEDQGNGENNAGEPSIGRKKAKKLLNQEFNQFLISMKAQNEQIKKNAPTNS